MEFSGSTGLLNKVLTILHGPSKTNLTLDESYFQHLQNLIVLEIHGFPNEYGKLRLRKNSLQNLENLRYINFQYLHLLGDLNVGNRPAPVSATQFLESNTFNEGVPFPSYKTDEESNDILGAVQFLKFKDEANIVPYSVYQDQQEQAGLSTFASLKNLIFLRAFHCNIKEVNWEMFDGLQKLEFLSLEGNKIPFIHEFSFYGTPNLKHLSMSHNKLLSIQSTSLAGLLQLEVLDLSNNNISHLSELSLPPFPKLVTADFHHNPVELILPHTFQMLNNTEQLFIGGKLAKLEIRHNSFLGLKKLRKLNLNGVNLNVLETEYLKGMHALRELRFEGIIHELAFDAFAEVPKLQELILKNCSVRKISMDAFFGLYYLMYLDLSHNELETLPPSLFDQQKFLKEVYLSYNKLTTLPEGLFSKTAAKLIRLDKNPWHCTCSMDEWQPSQINKVKVKVIDDSQCQTRYDKGSMCKVHYMYQYKYEQSVSPKCVNPSRYGGWSVFHLLRKHLRCQEKLKKYKLKTEKVKYNKVKTQYVGKIKETKENRPSDSTTNTVILLTTQNISEESHANKQTKNEVLTLSLPENKTNQQLQEHKLESNNNSNNALTNDQIRTETPKVRTESSTNSESNKQLRPNKDKNKYKLITKKEKNITMNTIVNKEDQTPLSVKLNIPNKMKQSSVQKRWEIKMENTKRRLNTITGNGQKVV